MKRFLAALGVLVALVASTEARAARNSLTWQDNSSGNGQELGFEVERKIIPNPAPVTAPVVCAGSPGTYTGLVTTPADQPNYIDNAVNANVTYCYRVRAVNATGASAYTNEAGRYVPFDVPPAPSSLTVSP